MNLLAWAFSERERFAWQRMAWQTMFLVNVQVDERHRNWDVDAFLPLTLRSKPAVKSAAELRRDIETLREVAEHAGWL